ncbi:MAG: NAD-dependent epimerase [Ponticaulis sp.]|nr:NAD-dependent epimerase [Ponticaulis sp.]
MIGVFGANGFIGTALVRRLVAEGHSVRAISRNFSEGFLEEFGGKVDIQAVDFLDETATAEQLKGLSVVYHLICMTSPGYGNTQLISDIEKNVIPHIAFIKHAIEAGVERFVFLSSGGTVYGTPQAIPIPETHPCNPISSYGLTKFVTEKYLQMFGDVDDLDYVIVRLSNPFGPGQVFKNSQGLIPAIIEKFKQNEPVTILGDGSSERDYIYIDDAITALVKIVGNDQVAKSVLNIGSGKGKSVLDVVGAVEAALGRELDKKFVEQRATDVKANILDIASARKKLNWSPETRFAEAINWTVQGISGVQ